MAFIQRSNSSRRRTTPLIQGGVVIAYDAMRNHNFEEFNDIISDVLRNDMVKESSTIMLLGVLDRVLHPSKFLRRFLDALYINSMFFLMLMLFNY